MRALAPVYIYSENKAIYWPIKCALLIGTTLHRLATFDWPTVESVYLRNDDKLKTSSDITCMCSHALLRLRAR